MRVGIGRAALAVLAVVTGCAEAGPRPATEGEVAHVQTAAAAVRSADTASVAVVFEARRGRRVVDSSELGGRVDFAADRVHFELENPWHRHFREDLRPGSLLRFELIADGTDWYVHVPDNPAAFGLGWAAVNAEDLDARWYPFPRVETFLDALEEVEYLEVVGEDTIDGAPVTHYQGAATARTLRDVLPSHDAGLRVEIWVHEAGPLKRVRYQLEQDRSSLSVSVTFSDLDAAQPVEVPDNITWQLTVADVESLEALYQQMGLGGFED